MSGPNSDLTSSFLGNQQKILRYCLWNVQQMGMAGHPRHSQRVELLLHIIYDNLDSVAGPDLRLQIWDSRAVLATSSVRGEPVSQSVSPSVSQVILEPLALRMRMRTSHQNLGHCVWPHRLDSLDSLDSTPLAPLVLRRRRPLPVARLPAQALRLQINAKWHV